MIEELKEKKRPAYQVMVDKLKKVGVNFYEDPSGLQNVVFEYKGEEFKIYMGIFYRVGGICVYYEETGKGKHCKVEVKKLTDSMFYEMQRLYVMKYFKL